MSDRVYENFKAPSKGASFHRKALRWMAGRFGTGAFLNTNGYAADPYGAYPWIIGAGAGETFVWQQGGDVFGALKHFSGVRRDWMFGFFSYELKNGLENLVSENPDHIGMPPCHFFRPVVVIHPTDGGLRIGCLPGYGKLSDPRQIFRQIADTETPGDRLPSLQPVTIRQRVPRERYLERVGAIRNHIQLGDIYEMNYCVEFFAEGVSLDPLAAYLSLNAMSQTPFSCWYVLDGISLACASPERFMRKIGRQLVSQPIKGTAPRGDNVEEDERLRRRLQRDPKERSENVMIVDLVRNDLSRSAEKDSVQVAELYGVYPFRQVNQMISTVTARLHPDVHYLDAIRNAFPMGSMTGAPKVRAMQLIDLFEDTRRGLYSGAVGYVSPDNDFDFNVVIRSILYNASRKYLSFMAGSAITIGSVAEREYDECLLKARAMGESIGGIW